MKDFIVKQLLKWLAPSTIRNFAFAVSAFIVGRVTGFMPEGANFDEVIAQIGHHVGEIIALVGSLLLALAVGKKKI